MRYFTQTGDTNASINQADTTPKYPAHNESIKFIQSPEPIFIDRQNPDQKVDNFNVDPNAKEELSKEEEKKFYKKVMRTSLL